MKILLLLCLIPSLIAAENICSDSKTTCPEDKECCEVDGKHSCCDLVDDQDLPENRMKVFPGTELMSSTVFANASLFANETTMHSDYCNFLNCNGKCCPGDYCCAGFASDCCGNNMCCSDLGKCCGGGCCSALGSCCGSGCCQFQQTCCDGWCCKKGHRCGPRYMTCRNKGSTISFDIIALLLLAASLFVSRRL